MEQFDKFKTRIQNFDYKNIASEAQVSEQWKVCGTRMAQNAAIGGVAGTIAAMVLFSSRRSLRAATIGIGLGVGIGIAWQQCTDDFKAIDASRKSD